MINTSKMKMYVSNYFILDDMDNFAYRIEDGDVVGRDDLKFFVDMLRYHFSDEADIATLYIYKRVCVEHCCCNTYGNYIIITRISNNGETHIVSTNLEEIKLFADGDVDIWRVEEEIYMPEINMSDLYELVESNTIRAMQ